MLNGNMMNSNMYGITLYDYSSYNTILNNNASSNVLGIYLDTSSNNNISNNTANSNMFDGFYIRGGGGNNLSNNIAVSNYGGINLYYSTNNTLSENDMALNTYNFLIFGSLNSHFNHTINMSNSVDGKPVYYKKGLTDTTYDSAAGIGWFGCISCNNVTLKDQTFMNNSPGVLFWNTSNSMIQN